LHTRRIKQKCIPIFYLYSKCNDCKMIFSLFWEYMMNVIRYQRFHYLKFTSVIHFLVCVYLILKKKFLRYERYLSDRYVININIIYHSCSSHILMTYQQQETVIKTVINLHGLLLIIRPLFQDTTFIQNIRILRFCFSWQKYLGSINFCRMLQGVRKLRHLIAQVPL
jgi:hypothetical protein